MQSPDKTIIEQLETDWNLTDANIKKNDIQFLRGEPADLTTRFAKKMISIETTPLTTPVTKRVLARSHFDEIINVNVWMKVAESKTQRKVDDAKDNLQKIRDKIRSIILARQLTMTNLRFVKIASERVMDAGLEEDPPHLRLIEECVCKYQI